jgi:hypothetical protein
MTSYDRYVEDEMDYDYNDSFDPEQDDAANNHGQHEDETTLCSCGCNTIANVKRGEEKPLTMEDILGIPKERIMNSNVKVISRPTKGISASTLKVGEYARITVIASYLDHVGDIVLKTVSSVVNISRPSADYPSFNTPQVERLNTGDKLEITVGFTAEFEERIRREAQSNKIMAIKSVREVTFWGLKESKDYVESLLLKL